MGKNKKKIKRTPLQLQKIREKRLLKEEENRKKKELQIKNHLKSENEMFLKIKEQLTEDDWNDLWFHLTPTNRYEKIEEEGLRGGVDGKHKDDKGFLYMVDTDCKKIWNGVSVYHLGQREDMLDSNGKKNIVSGVRGLFGRDKSPYIVLGIPKRVFELLNCPLSEDMTMDLTNYNQNHRRVKLGDRVIPSFLFKVVYKGVSDMWKYETRDRWVFQQKFIKRKFGKWVPKFLLILEDGMLGVIKYGQRKKINTKNLLKKSDKELEKYLHMKRLELHLKGSDFLKTSSQQNSQFVLNNKTSY